MEIVDCRRLFGTLVVISEYTLVDRLYGLKLSIRDLLADCHLDFVLESYS